MTIRIRAMTTADVGPATQALVRGDWGDRRDWWRFVVAHPGCIPIVAVEDDDVVGTGVGTIHGSVGWVGTIYVVPERRRRGLALELSRAVVEGLEAAGCRTLALAATPEGRGVYERLGFDEVDWYVTLGPDGIDRPSLRRDPRVRSVGPDDEGAILGLDGAVTGEDRSGTLRACLGTPGGLVLPRSTGRIDGFLLRAPWHGAAVIAPEPDDALALLDARLLDAGPDHAVRAGILGSNETGRQRLLERGWVERWRVVRMHRGAPLHWRSEGIWGQLGFALG